MKRLLILLAAIVVSSACSGSPTAPAPATHAPLAIAIPCNLVGDLPCQIPAPTTCTDPSATNVNGPLPCTFPVPVDPNAFCQNPRANNQGRPLPCTFDPPFQSAPPPPVVVPPLPPPTPIPAPVLSVLLSCTPAASLLATPCNVSVWYGVQALPSAAIVSVTWDLGDGTQAITASPLSSHVYSQAGTFTVLATVTASTVDGLKIGTGTTVIHVQ